MLPKLFRAGRGVVCGIGDDCAVLKYTKSQYQLMTSDMLVEGIHFKQRTSPSAIGWKALGVSVSDIAAMGGVPQSAVVSVGVPRRYSLKALRQLVGGMQSMASKAGVSVVGGDTVRAQRLTIDVAMLGVVEKKRLVLRSGARVGDTLFVTGKLGGAVRSGKHLKFTPRLKESRAIGKHFKIHAMIDLSDGLSGDLVHLTSSSGVGALIEARAVPRSRGVSLASALSEGEDFELLLAVPKRQASMLLRWSKKNLRCGLTAIGKVISKRGGVVLQSVSGATKPLMATGYRHF